MTSLSMPAISYTPSVIASQLVQDIGSQQSRQATLEQQLSSGNVVNMPSDDPAGASSILLLSSSLARAQQYVTNASDGTGWLSLGTSTLNQVMTTLQSARQAVLGLSGDMLSNQQSALSGVATQLDSARQQLISLANTTYGGQAIFSGTGNVSQAYDANGNYVGGGSAPERSVAPNVSVPVSVTGPQVFGSGTSGLLDPTGVLAQLRSDVSAGTPASLQQAQTTDLANLDAAIKQVAAQAAQMGANYQRMQGFSQQAVSSQAALQSQLSAEDNVDVAKVSTQLSQAQQTYQMALWATAQIEQQSLVQYLG